MNQPSATPAIGPHQTSDLKPPRRWLPSLIRMLLLFAVTVIITLAVLKTWLDARFFEGYDPGLPLLSEVRETSSVDWGIREKIAFQGLPGQMVPALYHHPRAATATHPCLVLVYGIGQDMRFLDEVAEPYVRAGWGILCFEQLGRGERKPVQPVRGLSSLLEFKQRISQMVVEVRRAVDYLASRQDVDPKRITLFGISLGAIMGTSALAFEDRFSSGILMWGGGDLPKLLTENKYTRQTEQPYLKPLLRLVNMFFLSQAEPLRSIHHISPRPLLFQNALHDEIIPKVCTEAYFEKAGTPKEILWYDCGHETGLSRELILKIIDDQILWLKQTV